MLEEIRRHCKPGCLYPHGWVAHDHPELRLAFGAWLCDCSVCFESLRLWADVDPSLTIVLKTGSDRVMATAAYGLAAYDATGGLAALCYVRNDYIREVFVASAPVALGARWYSTALERERGLRAACRAHALRAPAGSPHGVAEVDNPRMPRISLEPASRSRVASGDKRSCVVKSGRPESNDTRTVVPPR